MNAKNLAVFVLVALLAACGGGGGGGGGSGSGSGSSGGSPTSSISAVNNQSGLYAGVSNWVVGDLNGDGLDDVVFGGWNGPSNTANVTIFIQNTDGTLTEKTTALLDNSVYSGSQRLFISDFDHDGRADIWIPGFNDGCVGGCTANSVMLWGTTGKYTRQDFTDGLDSHGACLADMDGDGYLDMIVRGAYVFGQTTSGYYLNNHNRTFTFIPSSQVTAGATCSVVKDPGSNNFAILQGNTAGVAGYSSYISVLDSNLNLINAIGVTSHSNVANDLINSQALDVNGDGYIDFVMVFNQIAGGVAGVKEVWLNDGNGGFAYAYTIDSSTNNQYSIFKTNLAGQDYLMFDAPNGDAQLYKLNAGAWTLFGKSSFDTMATEAGGRPGVADWSIKTGLVYMNRNSNKIYMMQYVNGNFYTKLLQ
ncbi:hypothetical protein B9Z35_01610 [Limnohabitans sp. Jir61]|uniref:FG-GAP repeat domain-containing protein n=1 Tax=Limnohabitans sp. Jir61 TaxID=1826168 RepID=UPI000D3ACD66|nr:VCBS repeat-containing protein [Limnohabitans sp. Jir61]PUE32271.1 hypothetical protein B9Z35_01610 [Limnohabitans sp. Jir61]